MRVCRFLREDEPVPAFYGDDFLVPLDTAVRLYADATHERLDLDASADDPNALLAFLPGGAAHAEARQLSDWLARQEGRLPAGASVAVDDAALLIPVPRPNKLFLLAGNYARHIEEGGGVAAERAETFPYVFMKPPTTTLTHPGQTVSLPRVSPDHIDWELELAVVIGRRCKGVSESEALEHVAGYTVVNDISDRQFRPNPSRKTREKDTFFDWLHGKWHDGFCPCGPCITSADAIEDPQNLEMQLRVNGELKQDSSTARQIFPVAAVIEFISQFVTLEPGDMISTGTPSGVGHASQTYLQGGDRIEARIASIGTLVTHISGA